MIFDSIGLKTMFAASTDQCLLFFQILKIFRFVINHHLGREGGIFKMIARAISAVPRNWNRTGTGGGNWIMLYALESTAIWIMSYMAESTTVARRNLLQFFSWWP